MQQISLLFFLLNYLCVGGNVFTALLDLFQMLALAHPFLGELVRLCPLAGRLDTQDVSFAPFLAFGGVFALFFGDDVFDAYLTLL